LYKYRKGLAAKERGALNRDVCMLFVKNWRVWVVVVFTTILSR